MIPRYGGKRRIARKYPAPVHPVVVEPFAGGLGYTLLHRPGVAVAVEADPAVHGAWHRLVAAGPSGIRSMAASWLSQDYVDDPLCSLMSRRPGMFAAGRGCRITDWNRFHVPLTTEYAAEVWPYARTVDYRLGDYRDCPDIEATWFIDPPYQHADSSGYAMAGLDYTELAEWCLSRRGQVIVCEGPGADWLPFSDLAVLTGMSGRTTSERVWVRA